MKNKSTEEVFRSHSDCIREHNRNSGKTSSVICVMIFDSEDGEDQSMSMLLSNTNGISVRGSYKNGNRLIRKISDIQPHIILMDVKLPDICPLEAVKLIHVAFPQIKILMLADFDEDEIILDAICAGALGLILKNQPRENILETILKLQQGQAPISPFVLGRIIELLHRTNVPVRISQYNLTAREKEVINHMVEGASYKMVGDRLGICYNTVHNHIKNIYSKLQVNSMSEAVSKVLKTQMNLLLYVSISFLLASISLTPLA